MNGFAYPDNIVTVYFRGEPMFIYPCVAARFALYPGQVLGKTLATQVVEQNASHWHLLYLATHIERNN